MGLTKCEADLMNVTREGVIRTFGNQCDCSSCKTFISRMKESQPEELPFISMYCEQSLRKYRDDLS